MVANGSDFYTGKKNFYPTPHVTVPKKSLEPTHTKPGSRTFYVAEEITPIIRDELKQLRNKTMEETETDEKTRGNSK